MTLDMEVALVRITSTIRRRWNEQEGSVAVLVKTSLRNEDATKMVEDLVARFDRSSPTEAWDQDCFILEVQRTPSGPAVLLIDCHDLDTALARLSEGLIGLGHPDATLTALGVVRPFHGHGLGSAPQDVMGLISAFIALRGTPTGEYDLPDNWPQADRRRTWAVAPEDAAAALEYLVGWARDIPGADGTAALCTGRYTTMVEPDDALAAMRIALKSNDQFASNHVIFYADQAFRSVDFRGPFGIAAISEGTQFAVDFDWRRSLADVTGALSEAGPWCVYGHLSRGHSVFDDQAHNAGHRSLKTPFHWRKWGNWHSIRRVPAAGLFYDAFGVMRLPSAMANAVDLEPLWDTEGSSDSGSVLATHTRPADWFAHPQLNKETLAEGRNRVIHARVELLDDPEGDIWDLRQADWERLQEMGFTPELYWARGHTQPMSSR